MTRVVPRWRYAVAFGAAHELSENVRAACSPVTEMPYTGVRYYLREDFSGGYGVTDDGELIGLFSLNGGGRALVRDAMANGARRLDCFDGFLTDFYASIGWTEVMREANWTPGGPDVVYMEVTA